jgi:PelA/Pel-15E family pectate lyase
MNLNSLFCFGLFFVSAGSTLTEAAVIGTNTPAQPLTTARIAALPVAEQKPWADYLERSQQQRRRDQAQLQTELAALGRKESTVPPSSRGTRSLPLERDAAWYRSAEGRQRGKIILSFQTPAGGWSKNLNFAAHARAKGEGFAPDNTTKFLGTNDNDQALDRGWSYVGTIDNGGTTTPLRFLARVIASLPEAESAAYRAGFERGIEYLLAAQFPNGGWPQVWPLQGGYHDAITYNDGAMVNVLRLLDEVAAGKGDFAFVPQPLRQRAAQAVDKGLRCILATQVVHDGQRTVWCQQHDVLTLQPTSARNYEMVSLCSGESTGILLFLMSRGSADSNVVSAIEAGVKWIEAVKISDKAFRNVGSEGRLLVPSPGSDPLWARYYAIGSNQPLFGERDKTIHDDVAEISRERRQGYAWFTDAPEQVLRAYAKAKQRAAKK